MSRAIGGGTRSWRFAARLAVVLPAAVLLPALAVPATASAQSFLGFRALGVPVRAIDARATALGNLGIGLAGVEISATDPAASAQLRLPTLGVTMQPSWGSFDVGEQTGTSRTNRLPLLGIGYPLTSVGGVVTASLSGHLEQRWVAKRRSTVILNQVEVEVEDSYRNEGGTSVVRLGWAQRVGSRLSLGVSAGSYLGRLERVFDRELDSLAVGGEVYSFREQSAWRYSGYLVAAGFNADPHSVIHLAGAVEWSGTLREVPQEDSEGEGRYTIPVRFSAGATGRLSPRLALNVSGVYQDWGASDGFLAGVTSGRKWNYGAGVEVHLVEGDTRSLPVRLGYRRLAPPFRFESEDPEESVWSLGVGFNLVELNNLRLGWMDLAFERGSRRSAPLNERFWRATVSVGISR
ncbi:MAG: hypothetical protein OXL34_10360 [Gemmatimonadota bacterium]|nr:hypothetical protein [Gemmatimonadota bacterium]